MPIFPQGKQKSRVKIILKQLQIYSSHAIQCSSTREVCAKPVRVRELASVKPTLSKTKFPCYLSTLLSKYKNKVGAYFKGMHLTQPHLQRRLGPPLPWVLFSSPIFEVTMGRYTLKDTLHLWHNLKLRFQKKKLPRVHWHVWRCRKYLTAKSVSSWSAGHVQHQTKPIGGTSAYTTTNSFATQTTSVQFMQPSSLTLIHIFISKCYLFPADFLTEGAERSSIVTTGWCQLWHVRARGGSFTTTRVCVCKTVPARIIGGAGEMKRLGMPQNTALLLTLP